MTRLQKLRQERGITAFQLSVATGIHPGNVSKVENAKMVPSGPMKLAFVSFYGVDEKELFDAGTGLAAKV